MYVNVGSIPCSHDCARACWGSACTHNVALDTMTHVIGCVRNCLRQKGKYMVFMYGCLGK